MGNQIITQPQTFKTDAVVIGSTAGLSAVSGLTVYGSISATGAVYGSTIQTSASGLTVYGSISATGAVYGSTIRTSASGLTVYGDVSATGAVYGSTIRTSASGLTVYGDVSASGLLYGLNATLAKNEMTGTGGTTYTLVTYPSQNAEDYIVAVGGVVQTAGSAYSISGSSLIFTGAVASGSSIVALVSRGITANSTNIPSFKKNELSTTSGTAAYTMSYYSNNNADNYLVFLDGVMQAPTTDYTISGNQITMIPTPATTGLKLVVMSLQNVDGTYAATAAVDITSKIDKPSSPSAGQVLSYNGSTWVATASGSSGVTSGTAVTLTNQTSVDFTGIPNSAKKITVIFGDVSTNGSSIAQIQIGSGSVTTSGYKSSSTTSGAIVTSTTGFITTYTMASTYTIFGSITINLVSGSTYVASGNMGLAASAPVNVSAAAGVVTLAGTLDRVRITTVLGADQFDAGTVNVMWE